MRATKYLFLCAGVMVALAGCTHGKDNSDPLEISIVDEQNNLPTTEVSVYPPKRTTPTSIPEGRSSASTTTELITQGENQQEQQLLFDAHIQPLLETKCVTCHSTSGIGFHHLALTTAGDASDNADTIAFAVGINYMPPWFATDASVDFVNDWSLTTEERNLILSWAEEDGQINVPRSSPMFDRSGVTPNGSYGAVLSSGTRNFEADQVLSPRDGPYGSHMDTHGRPLHTDDYRCQVYEIHDPENDGTWATGFSFIPDTSAVHHAIIYSAPQKATLEIDERIASENDAETQQGLSEQPGWTCYGMVGFPTNETQIVHNWVPGTPPMTYPPGYGVYMEPGAALIAQVHYHYDDAPIEDASSLILDTASLDEVLVLKEMKENAYLTPAEIPCSPAEENVARERAATVEGYINYCERHNVLVDISRKFDLLSAVIPDSLIWQCGGNIDKFNNLRGTIGHSSCDLRVRSEGVLHTILPHMHEFGAGYRLTLNPGTPYERVLLDITNWDFNWQLFYEPVEDIHVTNEDIFRIECWWDRTLQPMTEPRYIIWNQGSGDEMCYTSIWTVPD